MVFVRQYFFVMAWHKSIMPFFVYVVTWNVYQIRSGRSRKLFMAAHRNITFGWHTPQHEGRDGAPPHNKLHL